MVTTAGQSHKLRRPSHIAEAERSYRMLMKGNDPSAAFNLGNMLRSCGRNVVAETALHAALQIALYLPLYGVVAYAFGRGIGLRQLVLDLRPAWTRRSTEAGS